MEEVFGDNVIGRNLDLELLVKPDEWMNYLKSKWKTFDDFKMDVEERLKEAVLSKLKEKALATLGEYFVPGAKALQSALWFLQKAKDIWNFAEMTFIPLMNELANCDSANFSKALKGAFEMATGYTLEFLLHIANLDGLRDQLRGMAEKLNQEIDKAIDAALDALIKSVGSAKNLRIGNKEIGEIFTFTVGDVVHYLWFDGAIWVESDKKGVIARPGNAEDQSLIKGVTQSANNDDADGVNKGLRKLIDNGNAAWNVNRDAKDCRVDALATATAPKCVRDPNRASNPCDIPATAFCQAHHVIPCETWDEPAAAIIHLCCFDLNGPDNLIMLPCCDYMGRKAAYHRGRTPSSYVSDVRKMLRPLNTETDTTKLCIKAKAILTYFINKLCNDGDYLNDDKNIVDCSKMPQGNCSVKCQ